MDNTQQQQSQFTGPEADTETPSAPSPETTNDAELEQLRAEIAELKQAVRTLSARDQTAQPLAGIDGGAGTLSRANMLTAEALAKMSPAQIQRLDWDDVRRVISQK